MYNIIHIYICIYFHICILTHIHKHTHTETVSPKPQNRIEERLGRAEVVGSMLFTIHPPNYPYFLCYSSSSSLPTWQGKTNKTHSHDQQTKLWANREADNSSCPSQNSPKLVDDHGKNNSSRRAEISSFLSADVLMAHPRVSELKLGHSAIAHNRAIRSCPIMRC